MKDRTRLVMQQEHASFVSACPHEAAHSEQTVPVCGVWGAEGHMSAKTRFHARNSGEFNDEALLFLIVAVSAEDDGAL